MARTLIAAALLAAAVAGCGGTAQRAPAQEPTVVFSDDFESGTLDAWKEVQRARPGSIRVVTGVARRGRRAARFELRRGDHVDGEEASRAELAGIGDQVGPGDRRVYAWSTLVPRAYPASRRWQVLAQWKNTGRGSPPLELDLVGRDVVLFGRVRGRSRALWRERLPRGRWVDFRARVRFDERHGHFALRAGGRVVVDQPLPTLARGQRSYFKLGLYRDGAIRDTAWLYHDAVSVKALSIVP